MLLGVFPLLDSKARYTPSVRGEHHRYSGDSSRRAVPREWDCGVWKTDLPARELHSRIGEQGGPPPWTSPPPVLPPPARLRLPFDHSHKRLAVEPCPLPKMVSQFGTMDAQVIGAFDALAASTVGIGSPPSLNRSSTNPASTNERSKAGKGMCVAPTLSRRPLSVHDAFVQWLSR